MIRDVLLCVYAAAWLIVIALRTWRDKEIDPVLWAALGAGVGVIMGIFRVDDSKARKTPSPEEERQPHD